MRKKPSSRPATLEKTDAAKNNLKIQTDLRLELVKICFSHGRETRHIIEAAIELEAYVLGQQENVADKATKTAPA